MSNYEMASARTIRGILVTQISQMAQIFVFSRIIRGIRVT